MELEKEEGCGFTIYNMADHVLSLIFSFLPLEDRAFSISRVNRRFRYLCADSIKGITITLENSKSNYMQILMPLARNIKTIQNRMKLSHLAQSSDRYGISNRAAAVLAFSVLEDV